jgi:hypothetical protein
MPLKFMYDWQHPCGSTSKQWVSVGDELVVDWAVDADDAVTVVVAVLVPVEVKVVEGIGLDV